jgi:hypothetical protein
VARSKRARARARAERARVTNAIRRIQDLRDGRRIGSESFIKITLSGPEYNQLLDRIGQKPELQGYFDNELRLVCLEYSSSQLINSTGAKGSLMVAVWSKTSIFSQTCTSVTFVGESFEARPYSISLLCTLIRVPKM